MSFKQIFVIFSLTLLTFAVRGQSVFDMPKLFPQHRQYLAEFITSLQKGNLLAAETAARAAVKLFPNDANWHYNIACVCARAQRVDEALLWLEKAIDLGFNNIQQLQTDTDLAALRTSFTFTQLLEKAKSGQVTPANATLKGATAETVPFGTTVDVTAANTQWNWDIQQGGYMITLLQLMGDRKIDAARYQGPYASIIQEWLAAGSAAGNAGDLYVNRDEDRSQVAYECFPALTPIIYSIEAQRAKAHVGAANGLFSSGIITHPVVGLSTLSLGTTSFWRSIPRLISTEQQADQLAFRLATTNQLYIYDAALDYVPAKRIDLFTAQATSFIISGCQQGDISAATQKAERLTTLILAGLAALQPETKRTMMQRGLLVPTFRMLLSRAIKDSKGALDRTSYPIVFDIDCIDGERFIRAAHELTPATLPVSFTIVSRYETKARRYIDYFDTPTTETISDTSWSIKRVIRSKDYTRKLTISATATEPGVTYQWIVVNGDTNKIRIRPLTKDASLTTLEIDYHGVYEQDDMKTRHVDLACIALRKGEPASAPSFVSLRYLANERRTYDDKKRIRQIDYTAPESGFTYEDPALTAFKNWRDDYHYDANGRLRGWTRTLVTGETHDFDALGRRILEKHPNGSAKRVVEVSYLPRVDAKSNAVTTPAIELLQADTPRILTL